MLKSSYTTMIMLATVYMSVLLFLLVAVPPVTEKLTTTSKGREARGGMMFTIIGRVILPTSASFTTSPGVACKNTSSIAEAIQYWCVHVENRLS